MGDEITVNDSISLTKGEIKNRGMSNNTIKIDQTGDGYTSGEMQAISDSVPEAIPMGDLTTPGRYALKNTGVVNVQIGAQDSNGFLVLDELEPGEPSSGRWGVTQPYALSVGAPTGKLEHWTANA